MPRLPAARSLVLHFVFFSLSASTSSAALLAAVRRVLRSSTKLASLPLRFKGSSGANMAPNPQSMPHQHRPTTKTSQKAFKSKHASKNSLRDKSKGMEGIPSRSPVY